MKYKQVLQSTITERNTSYLHRYIVIKTRFLTSYSLTRRERPLRLVDFSGPSLHKRKDAIEPLHLFYRYKGNENLHDFSSTFNFFQYVL